MTQKNKPGYPLPSGELGEDEIVCQLVYLPNRAEYWQALLGAISYMSTWRAWERDDDKRGKDAASNWREAFELTIGCWRMTCLEELTQTVTDILELMQTRKDCCDDNVTYLPVDPIETDIEPNVGDPPEEYGETEIADWEEWYDHVCYNAHKYVDYLAHAGNQLTEASLTSAIFIGLIAALLSLLAFTGVLLPVSFGLAAAIVSGIVLGGTSSTFAGTEQAIEDARGWIVCAIVSGGDVGAAVESALESGLDWDLFFQFIDYESATSILYEGGHNGEYLPAETGEEGCRCTIPTLGQGDSLTGYNPVVINSKHRVVSTPHYEQAGVAFYAADEITRKNVRVTAFGGVPVPSEDTGFTYHGYDKDDNEVFLTDIKPIPPFDLFQLYMYDKRAGHPPPPDAVEFDMSVTWEEVP